jgi:ElaB/YqjD/DUF883 family membrane-anchored ribosome-binding protein
MNDELNDPEAIRQQMEQTRESLQSKLEILEQQVKETVEEATGAVSETAQAVKETVENVKDTLQGTVETVKDTVQDTVETVKDTFDLNKHVQEHPWLMCAGAAALGFAGARLLTRIGGMQESRVPSYSAAPQMTGGTNGRYAQNYYSPPPQPPAPPAPPQRSWWSKIAENYSEELDKVRWLAIGTLGSVVREMVASNVGPDLSEKVKEVIDSVTKKAGGQIVEGPILTSSEETRCGDEPRSVHQRNDANGKTPVNSRW